MDRYFGLFPGRHDFPGVDGYVFPESIDPMDFETMSRIVSGFLSQEAGIHQAYSIPVNGMEDALCFTSEVRINVYVSGLTPATAALIQGCALNGVPLTLWHFNRATGEYVPQDIF